MKRVCTFNHVISACLLLLHSLARLRICSHYIVFLLRDWERKLDFMTLHDLVLRAGVGFICTCRSTLRKLVYIWQYELITCITLCSFDWSLPEKRYSQLVHKPTHLPPYYPHHQGGRLIDYYAYIREETVLPSHHSRNLSRNEFCK